MRAFGKLSSINAIIVLAAAIAAPAWGQASRTWVSSEGNNSNACTRSAPCVNFQRAHDQVADGGEINCVDAGSFGAVVINKSVTIDCTGVPAGAGSTFTPGVQIVGAGVNVVLRGLSMSAQNDQSSAISFTNGESLVVDTLVIQNFAGGIRFAPPTAARLHVVNTLISNNVGASAGTGDGINIDPTGAGYANVTLEDVRLIGNGGAALRVDVTGNTGSSTNVVVNRSAFTSSRNGVQVIAPTGTAGARVTLLRSVVSNNIVNGLLATGPAAQINVSNTGIAGNSNGVLVSGGTIVSYGNNELIGNGTNGAFSGVITQN